MNKIKNVFVYISIFLFLVPSVVLADGNISEQRDALIETARTFYKQNHQVQYDSFRKNLYATPEDATSQHYVYTVCSGFTFQTYYQTLGIEIPDTTEELTLYAKHNVGGQYSDYVLAYYGSASEIYSENVLGTTDTANYAKLAEEWATFLEPGDIIVYEVNGSSGHAMLVETVNRTTKEVTVLEAKNGGKYNALTHKDSFEPLTGKATLDNTKLVDRLKTRYSGKDATQLAIVRPVKDGNKYLVQTGSTTKPDEMTYTEKTYDGLTNSAKSRLKYRDIEIEKIAEVENDPNQQVHVNAGEKITYKLTIKNNSTSDYSSFDVVEYIDSNVKVVDKGNGVLTDNELKWAGVELKNGESITISYTVEVPTSKDLLGKILVSTGKVDNIATSKIETYVGNRLNSNEKSKLIASYENSKNNNLTERDFINQIYKDAFGLDLGLSNNLSNTDIIGYNVNITVGGKDKLSVKRTEVKDVEIAKYIYNNFYGLRTFKGVSTTVNANRECPEEGLVRITTAWNLSPTSEMTDRARDLNKYMLDDGDIILLYTTDIALEDITSVCPNETLENRSYIFLNDKLVRKTSTGIEEITGDDLDVFLRNIIGENYVILKPSIEYGAGISRFDTNSDGSGESNPITGLNEEGVYLVLGAAIVGGVVVYSFNKKKKYI